VTPSEQAPARLLPDGDEIGTPPADRRFRPDIQGLRALAVLIVIGYHAKLPLFGGGFVGVDVFFVISGFVITGVLLRERAASQRTSLASFWARRARRILPAATLVLVVTVAVTYLTEGVLRGYDAATDGRWVAVFLANFRFAAIGTNYLGAQAIPSPLLHFWSLSVEEQFYLGFPLIFAGAAVLGARWRTSTIPFAVGLVVLASFAWSVIDTASHPIAAYYSPFTRAWELGVGCMVALGVPALRRLTPTVAAATTWVGVALIGASVLFYSDATAYPGSAALVPVLGAALVIAGGVVAPRLGAELVLGTWVGLRLGELSFSLYLWHYPALSLTSQLEPGPLRIATKLFLFLVILALSIATYQLVENPVRHSRWLRRPARSLGLGAGLVALALGLLTAMLLLNPLPGSTGPIPGPLTAQLGTIEHQIGVGAVANAAPTSFVPSLASLHATALHSPGISGACISKIQDRKPAPSCYFGDTTATRTVVLLGDSQAMMWSSAVEQLAIAHHWRLLLLGLDGCPPWYDIPHIHDAAGCHAFQRYSLKRIASLHPALVLITGAPVHATGGFAADGAGLERLLAAVTPHAKAVGVLGPVPWFAGRWTGLSPPECIAEHSTSLTSCTLSVATLDRSFGAFAVQLDVAARHSRVPLVSLRRLFCTATTCPVLAAHRVIYHDPWHITPVWSTYVSPALDQLLMAQGIGLTG
jgi:peptidoglycan/LPS O-acetylase OafA/YrhL